MSDLFRSRLGILPELSVTRFGSAFLALLLAIPAPAHAQDDGDAAADDITVLKPIVLQGTKIPRDFLATTESVGVLTGQLVEDFGVDDLRESFSLFANVRQFEGNRGNNGFVIRGLSSEGVTQSSNNAPLTSVIIDGATQSVEATRRGARGLWDVEQVEIFRGPQSTLQGRGALAGAVIVQTRDPTFFFESKLRGILGTEDRREGAFFISGPIVDDVLAFRLSGEARSRSRGIHFNLPQNEIIGEDEFRSLRGKLLFQPADMPGLTLKLTLSDTYDKPGVNAVNGSDFFLREFNSAPTTAVEIREARNRHAVFEASYDFGNGLQLTGVTSFVDADTRIFTPAGFTYSREESRGGRDITQDVRLTFGSAETELSGVVGLFYGHFTLPRTSLVRDSQLPFDIQNLTSDDKTINTSVYADVNWRFASSWTLNLGGRLARERVSERQKGTFLTQPIDADHTMENTVFLPKLGLTYRFDDYNTLSTVARRGYRSGFTSIDDPAGPTNVAPEYLWSYELAWRTEDPGGHWRLGATAFHSRYTDQQIVIPATLPNLPRTVNAGKSRMWGVELDGTYAFANGFDLFGSVGYLRTRFDDFKTSGGDFSGNEFPEAPRWTAALGVNYRSDNGFFASATASFTDGYYSTGSIANDPALRVTGFSRVDVQAGYDWGNTRLLVYVDNLFDNQYLTSLTNGAFGSSPLEATISDPRMIGVQLEMTF